MRTISLAWPLLAVVLAGLATVAMTARAMQPAGQAGDCAPPRTDLAASAGPARVGEAMTIRWSLSDAGAPGQVSHLVIAVPEATRFEGRGFFALAPGAPGPQAMAFGRDRARAIVPLTTRFSRADGAVAVVPYRAGPMTIDWAIVTAGACGDAVTGTGSARFEIAPGAPRIVARDAFSSRRPSASITPLSGPFRALVVDGAVEVTDYRSGEVVLQATGYHPVFSPTGRFLAVQTGEEQVLDIYDLVAERRLGRFQATALYWSHADSFLFLDQEWEGGVQVVRTLHGRRDALEQAPRLALINEFRLDEAGPPAGAVHGGRDPDGEDLDPGPGGGSFTLGSEAWSLDLSVDAGIAAFLNTNPFLVEDGQQELPGRIIDLGLANPMITTERRDELRGRLATDFGLADTEPSRWSVHDRLWRTFDYVYPGDDAGAEEVGESALEESPIDFHDAPTQTATAVDAAAAPDEGDGEALLRSAVPLAPALRPASDVAAGALGLLAERPIAPLRTGDPAVASLAAELDDLYDDDVARFTIGPNRPEDDYFTSPFPDPAIRPGEVPVINLAAEGRDLWRFTRGDVRYFLTETVESGRLSHAFSFTLVGAGDGRLRRADLLAEPALDSESISDEAGAPRVLIDNGDARTALGEVFGEPSAVSLAGGRYLLVATRPVARLLAFDLTTWSTICAVARPVNVTDVDHLSLSDDASHIVQVNRNGRIEVYGCADGGHRLTGLVADDDLVVMDGNGYFDGSDDATGYVELRIAGLPGRHLLSQFAGRLRRPGLAQAVLDGTGDRPPATLDPPSLSVTGSAQGSLSLALRATRGLAALDIFANGRRVRRLAVDGSEATLALAASDLPNASFATLLAIDRDGLTSPPIEIRLDRSAGAGRLLGLSVGVDHYPDMPGADLRFAAADARRIAGAVAASPLYRAVDVATLLDGDATETAILSRLDRMIAEAEAEDTLLVSFAGHGLIGGDGRLRLALATTDRAAIDTTSLAFDAVADRIKAARARVIVLLDACHSGVTAQTDPTANDNAVARLVTAGGGGIVILSASKGRQFSEELAEIDGGRFSVAFAEALSAGRNGADRDANGAVSLLELYRAVKGSVGAGSAGRQIPWLARNQIYGDFDLF